MIQTDVFFIWKYRFILLSLIKTLMSYSISEVFFIQKFNFFLDICLRFQIFCSNSRFLYKKNSKIWSKSELQVRTWFIQLEPFYWTKKEKKINSHSRLDFQLWQFYSKCVRLFKRRHEPQRIKTKMEFLSGCIWKSMYVKNRYSNGTPKTTGRFRCKHEKTCNWSIWSRGWNECCIRSGLQLKKKSIGILKF